MNRIFLLVLLILLCTFSALAQVSPKNVLKPPTAALKKFEPFLGKYNLDYAGLKGSGTLEIKLAIKGWYIERTILTKTDDGIDREFRSLITYDVSLKSYRVWVFETLPPLYIERSGRFEGNDFVEEVELTSLIGSKSTRRSRYTMTDKDELRILTESENATGKIKLGVTIAKRVK